MTIPADQTKVKTLLLLSQAQINALRALTRVGKMSYRVSGRQRPGRPARNTMDALCRRGLARREHRFAGVSSFTVYYPTPEGEALFP